MEMVRIYRKRNFNIYSDHKGTYIVHNSKKEFSCGHTHINNFNTAKFVINMAIHKSIPTKNISNYLIESIMRISTDNTYINRLSGLKKKK